MNQKNKEPSKGFITVATNKPQFLVGATNLCESILDQDINNKVTLFTEQKWIDDPTLNLSMFDKVIATPGDHKREKMWGMANTPYDLTFYIDADCEVDHSDITNSFDRLENGKHDMCWVELKKETAHHFAEWDWGTGDLDHLTHCGGICLYDARNPLVIEFMKDWYENYLTQESKSFHPPEYETVPDSFKQWDQLTLWYHLWHDPKYKELKWKYFDDNYRWNYYTSFGFNKDGTHNYSVVNPVIIHYSAWMDKGDKGFL
tara:strand:+ start:13665 stop:14441 length:777 start_codon:yes stop_codon:yes gene_type:complete